MFGESATTEIIYSWAPLWVIILPMLSSIALYFLGLKGREKLRDILAVVVTFFSFALVLSLYPLVQRGIVETRLAGFMNMGLLLRVDLLSFVFAVLISLAWCVVTLYSIFYMYHEQQRTLYYSFLVLTFGSCLGVVLTGDFFSLFLFFEIMTFSSYVLVIQRPTRESREAGMVYLYMGVAGGLVLLFAIFLLFAEIGTLEIAPFMQLIDNIDRSSAVTVFICFIIGFGIKAGVIPLHIWMPRAYPNSFPVVNAVSSGAMIKAGSYGILRVTMMFFTPTAGAEKFHDLLVFPQISGYWVVWLGIVTMCLGAIMALMQTNALRLLAYSSISQMGYIITGIGAGAILTGTEEAMGFSGAVYHMFNHTLYKIAFFLIIAYIYVQTKEVDFTKIRGLAKKMPFITVIFVIAFLGIAGIPGFNGYISKTLIHDALLEAYKLRGSFSILIAEKIFILASALTICYYLKLFQGLFLGNLPEKYDHSYKVGLLPGAILMFLGLLIIIFGIFPNFWIEGFLLPAAKQTFSFNYHGIEHLVGFNFWDRHLIEAVAIILLLAGLIYTLGTRLNWFNRRYPSWLSIEGVIYQPVIQGLFKVCYYVSIFDKSLNKLYEGLGKLTYPLARGTTRFDGILNEAYERTGKTGLSLARGTTRFDGILNRAYEHSGKAAKGLAERTTQFDGVLNKAYEGSGKIAMRLADRTTRFDSALNEAYESSGRVTKKLADRTTSFDEVLNDAYEKTGETARYIAQKGKNFGNKLGQTYEDDNEIAIDEMKNKQLSRSWLGWNIRGLNFDLFLLVFMLGLILFLLFYYAKGF